MTYEEIGRQIGELVDTKNKQYGDAFNKTGEFLKILYPNGIEVEDYASVLALVRVFDKMMRIANGNQGDENAWNDLAGYGILMAEEDSKEKQEPIDIIDLYKNLSTDSQQEIYEELEKRLSKGK